MRSSLVIPSTLSAILGIGRSTHKSKPCPKCGHDLDVADEFCDRCDWTKTSKPAPGPVALTPSAPAEPRYDFAEQARALSASKRIPLHAAMSELARTKPELHEAYLGTLREGASLKIENRQMGSNVGALKYQAAQLRAKQ